MAARGEAAHTVLPRTGRCRSCEGSPGSLLSFSDLSDRCCCLNTNPLSNKCTQVRRVLYALLTSLHVIHVFRCLPSSCDGATILQNDS